VTAQESDNAPLLEARSLSKSYGAVQALDGISFAVRPGEVHCLLGDNGAGKSTLIKILAGVISPDVGSLRVGGKPTHFTSPRRAAEHGIATVYQDLAVLPLMSVARNFFLGAEPTKGWGPTRRVQWRQVREIAASELRRIGIKLDDVGQHVGTLSGGQRQSVAIARALYFGAVILILDEPTAALGVRESESVLRLVAETRDRGIGVVLVTHNVAHAATVGDLFTVLNRGRSLGTYRAGELSREQLQDMMAGGVEFERLADAVRTRPHPDAAAESAPGT
jgi:simple sugar transport system ATP-binding protein